MVIKTDKIIIHELEIFAYHGVNPEEKIEGQRFVMDITACVDLAKACKTDALEDTVSYAKLIKTARAVFTAQKDDLIERAAQRVADALLTEYADVEEVTILLRKPDAPVKARFAYTAVEITRNRGQA